MRVLRIMRGCSARSTRSRWANKKAGNLSEKWTVGATVRGLDLITPMKYDFMQRVNSYLLSKHNVLENKT